MSLIAASTRSGPAFSRTVRRAAAAVAALAFVAIVLSVAGWALGLSAGAVAPKNPFGTGLREAGPGAGGIGGWILAVQSDFYRALTGALREIGRGGGSALPLAGIGFLYGVFHAAGPGHGKGVIAGYLLATKRTLAKGLALSLGAALVQAAVAIALVGALAALLGASAAAISATAGWIEITSFAALACVGAALLWRKTARIAPADGSEHGHHHEHAQDHHHHGHEAHPHEDAHHASGHVHDAHCGHVHAPPAALVERIGSWRESAGIVLAAGIRPCSGAIILLVFALSQGLFAIGVAAVLAMALGTALTTGALAALAVLAKGTALRLAGTHGTGGEAAVAWLEVLASAFVTLLGLALLAGAWSGGLS